MAVHRGGAGPGRANGGRLAQLCREGGVGAPRLHHLPLPPTGLPDSPGTRRTLSWASHFPFSLPRQMFFSASLIPVSGL